MSDIRDRLWEKAAKKKIPLTAAFELLPVCNFSCKMCYVRKSMAEVQAEGGILSGKEWLKRAEEAQKLGMLYPLLTGGEPLLHPDFREIYQGMQDMGMQISVNSNGSLINEETARWFNQHVPVRINITLYGASEETYEKLCGNGAAWGKVRDAVQWLKKYNVRVKFNTSITPLNRHDMEKIIAYAHSVDSPIQIATYMFPPFRRDEQAIGQNERMTPEEAGQARAYADYLQNEPEWFLGQAERYKHFIPWSEDILFPIPNVEMGMRCRAGTSSLWLDWKGNFLNCGMYGAVAMSGKDRSFADLWKQMVEENAAFRYQPVCAKCPNQMLCHPCIAMVHDESGQHNGRPEYICRMNESAAFYYQKYAAKILEEHPELKPIQMNDIPGCDIDV